MYGIVHRILLSPDCFSVHWHFFVLSEIAELQLSLFYKTCKILLLPYIQHHIQQLINKRNVLTSVFEEDR